MCIDFDHLPNVGEMKSRLLTDEYFDTQLLFTSPSGDGLKWIISIPPPSPKWRGAGGEDKLREAGSEEMTHSDYFKAVANYIQQTYSITVDKSGRDISRACFLPHDPDAYINPIHIKKS